jgi:hypothetical protein
VLIAQRPTLSEESLSEFRSRFVIEPLEPGFGYTLGNSLRRTLLSSIPGAAVTSIRIDNIQHEFATIPGVKEDVVEIVLNIKNLVVSSEHDEPITAYLRKQGAGQVTAADISAPTGFEIHNPELVIATLNDTAKFELELTIERARSIRYPEAHNRRLPGAVAAQRGNLDDEASQLGRPLGNGVSAGYRDIELHALGGVAKGAVAVGEGAVGEVICSRRTGGGFLLRWIHVVVARGAGCRRRTVMIQGRRGAVGVTALTIDERPRKDDALNRAVGVLLCEDDVRLLKTAEDAVRRPRLSVDDGR